MKSLDYEGERTTVIGVCGDDRIGRGGGSSAMATRSDLVMAAGNRQIDN